MALEPAFNVSAPLLEFAEPVEIDTVHSRASVSYKRIDEAHSRAKAPYDRFTSQYEKDLPAPNSPTTTSHQISGGDILRASVLEKEIAGIVYNLVVVEQNWVDTRAGNPTAMVLQREDPHDRNSNGRTSTEPLRL